MTSAIIIGGLVGFTYATFAVFAMNVHINEMRWWAGLTYVLAVALAGFVYGKLS